MEKIRLTKNELKAQRDALARFTRYLPNLQLKKQQLQLEIRKLDGQVKKLLSEEANLMEQVSPWLSLFSEDLPWESLLKVKEVRSFMDNIAGVDISALDGIDFTRQIPHLFLSPPWIDQALEVIEKWLQFRMERKFLEEQARRLSTELLTTTQRVNLFEKIKIPEAQENIRIIRIFLEDEQTAAVARAKLAKGKSARLV